MITQPRPVTQGRLSPSHVPGLERPGGRAATHPSPGPWEPRQGANQLLLALRCCKQTQECSLAPVLPAQTSFVSRVMQRAQKAWAFNKALPPSHQTGFRSPPQIPLRTSCVQQRHLGQHENLQELICTFFLLVLGEKQPPKQTSRLIKRKMKAKW